MGSAPTTHGFSMMTSRQLGSPIGGEGDSQATSGYIVIECNIYPTKALGKLRTWDGLMGNIMVTATKFCEWPLAWYSTLKFSDDNWFVKWNDIVNTEFKPVAFSAGFDPYIITCWRVLRTEFVTLVAWGPRAMAHLWITSPTTDVFNT